MVYVLGDKVHARFKTLTDMGTVLLQSSLLMSCDMLEFFSKNVNVPNEGSCEWNFNISLNQYFCYLIQIEHCALKLDGKKKTCADPKGG